MPYPSMAYIFFYNLNKMNEYYLIGGAFAAAVMGGYKLLKLSIVRHHERNMLAVRDTIMSAVEGRSPPNPEMADYPEYIRKPYSEVLSASVGELSSDEGKRNYFAKNFACFIVKHEVRLSPPVPPAVGLVVAGELEVYYMDLFGLVDKHNQKANHIVVRQKPQTDDATCFEVELCIRSKLTSSFTSAQIFQVASKMP